MCNNFIVNYSNRLFTFRQAEELKLELEYNKLAEKSAATHLPRVLSYEEALQRNANTLKVSETAF